MIITLIKKQTGYGFVKDMEAKYGSIHKIKNAFEQTYNMKLLVDMENWEYYKDHLDETLELSESLVTDDIELSKLDLKLLNTIKHQSPKSIREVAGILGIDVRSVQSRLKKLEETGFIEFVEGNKNSLRPHLTYDNIKITI